LPWRLGIFQFPTLIFHFPSPPSAIVALIRHWGRRFLAMAAGNMPLRTFPRQGSGVKMDGSAWNRDFPRRFRAIVRGKIQIKRSKMQIERAKRQTSTTNKHQWSRIKIAESGKAVTI
jgi:hypothetical protein